MENVEAISELNVFRAMLLVGVERGTDLLHLLDAKRLCTSELGILRGQEDREVLG